MQIVLNVMARPATRKSLRETIISDLQKSDYGLEVILEKKIGRTRGWAKIKADGLTGALNSAAAEFNAAEQDWKGAEAAHATFNNDEHYRLSHNALAGFQRCIEKFQAGDAAQG